MAKVFEREFAGSSGGGTTSAINTSASGCKLIVVSISYYTGSTPTLSDSAGNTYTPLTPRAGTDYLVRLYYCINPTLSASHTWTVSGAASYPVMEVVGFDDTVSYEDERGAVNLISNGQPGSITPTANGAILVTACSGAWGAAASINSGFTLLGGVGTTGQQVAGGAAFLIQATAAAINPTWSGIGVNANNAFAMAAFVPSSGDTTPPALSSPVATSTGSTTGTLGCTTANDANGTMYFVGTGSTTVPSKAQVKAGQDHTSTLLASGRRPTLAITSTGAKSVGLTGLSASTTYHGYAMHEDAAGNQSDVLYLGSFTTAAPNTPPTFPGPNIANMTAKRGQNIGTLDVSSRFSDTDALTFSAIGSWPAGVTISSAGVITRVPTAVPGTYTGLQVRATDTAGNTQDSNALSFTVQQCVLALNSAGYEIGDGNSAATMAVLASTSLNIAAYLASEWPPSTLLASATASTDTAGRLANLGDDDFIFGTLYQVLLRNPSDGERWIWTMQAS